MTRADPTLNIAGKAIGEDCPTYFIADIAANHDGDLERAKELIFMAADAGADAAKFQHFSASTIVSDLGFKALGGQLSHQSKWRKSVSEVYQDATVPMAWTSTLKDTCDKAEVAFLTSPYNLELVDHVTSYVSAFKIGSGDITWLEIIEHIASMNKPYIIATGASGMDEVQRAVDVALSTNTQLALLQCNTNYMASRENFNHIHLNVLKCYRAMYPSMVLGLSDHTLGHTSVLGAVALGARIVEKHFTDDTNRQGPDHSFSMSPKTWRDMVDATRDLESALGTGIKKVEENERETAILQRRAVRAATDLPANTVLAREHLSLLRPCPVEAISPDKIDQLRGKKLARDINAGAHLTWNDLA